MPIRLQDAVIEPDQSLPWFVWPWRPVRHRRLRARGAVWRSIGV